MHVPNAENAVIAAEKLRDYLLNPQHRRGATKARLLAQFGYQQTTWPRLETDLRTQHLTVACDRVVATDYGMRYEIVGPIVTPSGRSLTIRSVWQIDRGTNVPRLITMFPE